MISSRCDPYEAADHRVDLPQIRLAIQRSLEGARLLSQQLYDVFCHENRPVDNHDPVWQTCLNEARSTDILLVLFNHHSGGGREAGLGICWAEINEAVQHQRSKVRVIAIPRDEDSNDSDARFIAFMKRNFNYTSASTTEKIVLAATEHVFAATVMLAKDATKKSLSKTHSSGQALEWSRLDYHDRTIRLLDAAERNIHNLPNAKPVQVSARRLVKQGGILYECHAVPDRLTVAQARGMLGRPFLQDHQLSKILGSKLAGPIHLVACYRSITETQAKSILGLDDLIVVQDRFGIYVVDRLHKIQLVFLTNCRDEYLIDSAFRSFWDWLNTESEGELLIHRARQRTDIVKLLSKHAE